MAKMPLTVAGSEGAYTISPDTPSQDVTTGCQHAFGCNRDTRAVEPDPLVRMRRLPDCARDDRS